MTQHTEGPWHIVPKYAPLTGDGVVCELDILSIRPRDGVKLGREGDDANLIAAAPDLLEALEDLMNTRDTYLEEVHSPDLIAQARAAIAKAKGEHA